jgi:transcriptional regulator with XRE-family HTH domain
MSGMRLREERERLGYSQNDFAACAAVTRKTLFNWESGAGNISIEALRAWSPLGLDVLYVVTGQRLSARHRDLLSRFDAAPESGRVQIENLAAQLAWPGRLLD